jgi:two-component system nitrogen regulation sensor histidine kinase GlnL
MIGQSRRSLVKSSLLDWFREPAQLHEAIQAVSRNEFATRRFEGPCGAAWWDSPIRCPST